MALAVRYSLPKRSEIDPDIRNALRRLLGEPGVWPGAPPSPSDRSERGPAPQVLRVKVLSAAVGFVPFVYDRYAQNQEYLGEVRWHTQLWYGKSLIKDWHYQRQRPVSVRPREHHRNERLREFRAELAEWAVHGWLGELRWIVGSHSVLETSGKAHPDGGPAK